MKIKAKFPTFCPPPQGIIPNKNEQKNLTKNVKHNSITIIHKKINVCISNLAYFQYVIRISQDNLFNM